MSEKEPVPAGRVIEQSVTIDATLHDVWRAISEGEGFELWFSPEAEVTPGVGGSVRFSFGPGEEWISQIEVFEADAHLRLVSEMPSAAGTLVRLAVDLRIHSQGGKTVVRLVHSGFDGAGWDDFVDGVDAGWAYFLTGLRHALERHPGRPRRLLFSRTPLSASVPRAQQAVFGPEGLDLDVAPDGLTVGRKGHLKLGSERQAFEVLVNRLPRTLALLLPELENSLLFVERESLQDEFRLGLWLSTFGLAPARITGLQADLDDLGRRLAGALGS